MKIGVDIGNSGLKIARLDAWASHAQHHRTTTLPAFEASEQRPTSETSVQRIDWLHRTSLGDSWTTSQLRKRYSPNSADWLPELKALCDQWQVGDNAHWLLSSVRQDASKILIEWLAHERLGKVTQVSHTDIPMQIDVDAPEKVGVDRLLAAFAATHRTQVRPLVVIQAGSAVTVDLVRQNNRTDAFCGGAILPGVPMMLRLLGQGTDKLPRIEADDLSELPPLPGRNTQSAMMCGAASALVGGINHLISRYQSDYGPSTQVIVSGGDGALLSSHIPGPVVVHQQLVIAGLACLEK